MLQRRIVVCLDVRDGKTTKGIKFLDNEVIGDPTDMAAAYYEAGVDELVFYDITASAERRGIMLDVVRRVAQVIFIPFSVGGGIGSVDAMYDVLLAGAEKVSVNSQAVRDPSIIDDGSRRFGNQCVVLGIDARRDPSCQSGYRVVIDGGRRDTERDLLEWAREGQNRGAGEIVLNAIDTDGTRSGYELVATGMLSRELSIPIVASGGAGEPRHVVEVFREASADAALIASMVHYGDYTIDVIKQEVDAAGIPVRLDYSRN